MRTIRYILVTGALLGLLSACDMPQKPEADKLDAGKVLVSIQIANEYATAAARSVLPQIALDDVDHFALWGAPVGTTETELIPSFTQAGSIALNAGAWDFTVRGYDGAGALILQGELKGQSVSSVSNSFSFSVAPLLEGTGSIAITITLPSGSGVTTAAVFKDGQAETSLPVAANRVIYTVASIDAGNYFYSFRLNNTAGNTIAIVSQVVQVRAHVRSEKTIAVSMANLNVLPDTPAVPLIEAGDGQLTVHWEPVPMVGDYEVYYSETAIPPDTPAQTLSNTTGAVISGLANGTAYYVWVKAKNAAGTSDYSPAASGKPLGIPTVTVTTTGAVLTVSWAAVAGADEYDVYCGISPTQPDTAIQTGIPGTSTVITNLANGIYYVWVQAKNACGTTTSPYALVVMRLLLPPVWYVSSTGNDTNNGLTPETALATVKRALEYTQAEYGNEHYPKVEGIPETTSIIISGTITEMATSNGMIEITGANVYPPIELRGKTVTETGTLNANQQNRVLYIADDNKVTLSEHLTITGGKVSSDGGGVYNGGTFTMSGGEIAGNLVTGFGDGGGVCNDGGTFTMSGGEIAGNSASSYGGGVKSDTGTFIMSGGKISGNSSLFGGGVENDAGTFIMSGGKISGNSSSYGGGVDITGGTFTMSDGEISSNTTTATSSPTSSSGGGVLNFGGTFTMSGGEIAGNSAVSGGGVYSSSSATFQKTGGIIYGDTDTTHSAGSTENTATSGNGHAVYMLDGRKRNSNAGPEVMLDSAISGSAGGWD